MMKPGLSWNRSARRRMGVEVTRLDRITYVVLSRVVAKRYRKRYGNVVFLGVGSYGAKQAGRTLRSMAAYGVLDQVEQLGTLDLDSQIERIAFSAVPQAVGAVAVFPAEERIGSATIDLASEADFGLRHRSIDEVKLLRYLWEPPLNDFIAQLNLALHGVSMPTPPLVVIFLSAGGGHAYVCVETGRRLRELYPDSVIIGVTISPAGQKRTEFAAFLEELLLEDPPGSQQQPLDYLLITDNQAGPFELHDDLVLHMFASILQDARRGSGGNPANVFEHATVARLDSISDRRTRLMSIEYLADPVGIEGPPRLTWLQRILGRQPGLPATSRQVLVVRASQMGMRLAARNGRRAGPLPLAEDTSTAFVFGFPSNDSAAFGDLVGRMKTRFEFGSGVDHNRLLVTARMAVRNVPVDGAAPLVAVRLGEMEGSQGDIVRHFRERPALTARRGVPVDSQSAALHEQPPAKRNSRRRIVHTSE